MAIDLVRQVRDVSADWLTTALREAGSAPAEASVTDFDVTPIGTGQMSQSTVALLILAPAEIDLPPIEHQSLGVPCSFGTLFRQCISFLFISGNLLLQLVDLSAGTSLLAIERAGIKEEWPTHLVSVFIHSCGGQ